MADDARCVAAFAGFWMLASEIGFLSERATSRSRYQRSRYLLDRLVHREELLINTLHTSILLCKVQKKRLLLGKVLFTKVLCVRKY